VTVGVNSSYNNWRMEAMTVMVNSVYNGHRFEDLWLDS
jgi:hypothetical protein